MPRPHFTRAQREAVYQKTGGLCYHCRQPLQAGWHVDHHPVPYRDIENNIACCAVRDPELLDNLQPSCPRCNTSHRHEPDDKAVYCGHTQPYVNKSAVSAALVMMTLAASLILNIHLSSVCWRHA